MVGDCLQVGTLKVLLPSEAADTIFSSSVPLPAFSTSLYHHVEQSQPYQEVHLVKTEIPAKIVGHCIIY